MNDCTNAMMRDQLPDLLHERLDASARAVVLAHVNECVDCRDEMQLLRDVQRTLAARAPRVDINYVIGALPKAPAPKTVRLEPRRRIWSDWRVAAAVTLLVAGGGSFALMNSTSVTPVATVIDTPSAVAVTPAVTTPVAETANEARTVAAKTATPAEVATSEDPANASVGDSRLGDLNEQQLQALISDIQGFRAVPATEPEPVSIRVPKTGSSDDAMDGEGA